MPRCCARLDNSMSMRCHVYPQFLGQLQRPSSIAVSLVYPTFALLTQDSGSWAQNNKIHAVPLGLGATHGTLSPLSPNSKPHMLMPSITVDNSR